jgi:hypothetical protein
VQEDGFLVWNLSGYNDDLKNQESIVLVSHLFHTKK